jgi:hypothetical protein
VPQKAVLASQEASQAVLVDSPAALEDSQAVALVELVPRLMKSIKVLNMCVLSVLCGELYV